MFETLFPLGIEQYIFGGLLVGLGIGIPYIFTGTVAGVSTFFTATWSYCCSESFFQTDWYKSTRSWRWFLTAGLMSGGALYVLIYGPTIVTEFAWWRLLAGGVLVGIGARMSGGCTSGHGICGLAALEKVSLVATLTFLTVAIIVAHITALVL